MDPHRRSVTIEVMSADDQLALLRMLADRRRALGEDQLRIKVAALEQFGAADCNRVRAPSSTLLPNAPPRSVPTTAR